MRELADLHRPGLDEALISEGTLRIQVLESSFLEGIPFAYLLTFSEFYHHRFFVNSDVLIPRPETEYLVDLLVQLRKKRSAPYASVLDVATGSGVILLSLLAQDFALMGTGSDISNAALNVAKLNARHLRIEARFVESDRLEKIEGLFEVIVSNPPYIKRIAHHAGVHKSVERHEPHLALFLKDSEYDSWFSDFFMEVKAHLLPGGVFAMEGHEKEIEQQALALRGCGFEDVTFVPDLAGIPRYLMAKKGTSS
jgi:release factor glutamine methyltransferase